MSAAYNISGWWLLFTVVVYAVPLGVYLHERRWFRSLVSPAVTMLRRCPSGAPIVILPRQIPEPGTLSLFVVGIVGLMLKRRQLESRPSPPRAYFSACGF